MIARFFSGFFLLALGLFLGLNAEEPSRAEEPSVIAPDHPLRWMDQPEAPEGQRLYRLMVPSGLAGLDVDFVVHAGNAQLGIIGPWYDQGVYLEQTQHRLLDNPPPGELTFAVTTSPDTHFDLGVSAIPFRSLSANGGSVTVVDQPGGNWAFFAVDIPPEGLGWVPLLQTQAGAAALVIRRRLAPWAVPGTSGSPDGLRTSLAPPDYPPDSVNWQYRISSWPIGPYEDLLSAGLFQPPSPRGTTVRWVLGVRAENGPASYTLTCHGLGLGASWSLPIRELPWKDGSLTIAADSLPTVLYTSIPQAAPSWSLETQGGSVTVLKDGLDQKNRLANIRSIDHGLATHFPGPGQAARNWFFIVRPSGTTPMHIHSAGPIPWTPTERLAPAFSITVAVAVLPGGQQRFLIPLVHGIPAISAEFAGNGNPILGLLPERRPEWPTPCQAPDLVRIGCAPPERPQRDTWTANRLVPGDAEWATLTVDAAGDEPLVGLVTVTAIVPQKLPAQGKLQVLPIQAQGFGFFLAELAIDPAGPPSIWSVTTSRSDLIALVWSADRTKSSWSGSPVVSSGTYLVEAYAIKSIAKGYLHTALTARTVVRQWKVPPTSKTLTAFGDTEADGLPPVQIDAAHPCAIRLDMLAPPAHLVINTEVVSAPGVAPRISAQLFHPGATPREQRTQPALNERFPLDFGDPPVATPPSGAVTDSAANLAPGLVPGTWWLLIDSDSPHQVVLQITGQIPGTL